MNDTIVLIDDGFLSKLSKFFGEGKHLKVHRKDFADNIAKKEFLNLLETYVYTAPPFQSRNPTKEEEKRKKGYDRFIKSLKEENIIVREGRCQKFKINGEEVYTQKGVDTLLVMDLMRASIKHKQIKKIILVASDSDFVPIIKQLQEDGIQLILYTYFNRSRKDKFSTSNDLIKSVHKYVKLNKQDFLNNTQ